jgi:outer membrane immunogenic protein
VRGRIGYAVDRALVYGTGGFAYAGCDNCNSADGWALGGGVEYKLAPSWSVKGEYQRIELSDNNVTAAADTFRVGVNFFVGGGYDPLK